MFASLIILMPALVGLLGETCLAQFDLEKSSFSIRSIVARHNRGERQKLAEIEESYSREQRRARIDYKIISKPDGDPAVFGDQEQKRALTSATGSGSFVYDAARKTSIRLDRVCTKINLEEIETTIGFYLPREDEDAQEIDEDFIVGPSRLLFFLAKRRNKMALVENSVKIPLRVRNVPSLMYSLKYRDKRSIRDVELFAIYTEISLALDKDKAVPSQVLIKLDGLTTSVDFRRPELILPGGQQELLWHRFERYNKHAWLDYFAYKLALGCSAALEEKQENPFTTESKFADAIRQFSFSARIESFSIVHEANPNVELFVAYDKAVNSLRIDSLNGASDVYNFNTNRAYHVRDKRSPSLRFGGSHEVTLRDRECIVSKIYDTEEPLVSEVRYSLSEILLGSEKFVYMGRGQVDGIDALVYEVSEANLPFWVDHEVLYNESSKARMRGPLAGISDRLDQPKTVDLVAYFDDSDDQHRLLMLDINHVDKERTKMFGKQTIRIEDFVWKVDNQSPTGLQTGDLFSLADDCPGDKDRNRYDQVSLRFESRYSATSGDSSLDIVGLRETALLASLQDQYHLPATMIFDLETNVRRYKDPLLLFSSTNAAEKTLIQVSFKLARRSDNLVGLKSTGLGSSSAQSGEGVLHVRTFEECFVEVASRNEGLDFGFRPEDNVCLFGVAVLKLYRAQALRTSQYLKPSSNIVELYRIERTTEREFSAGEDRLKSMKQLQTITLAGVEKTRARSPFIIKALDFHQMDRQFFGGNENGDELASELENFKQLGLIEGMGIVEDKSSKRIGTGEDRMAMNEEGCHAACLSDAECKTYSICVINLETNCIISSLNLTDHLTREIITLRLKEDKDQKKWKKFTLELSDSQQQQQLEKLELIKHPNCRIRVKKYLDLFTKPTNRYDSISKGRIYAVADIDKCAEMVTMRNIKTIQDDTKHLPDVLSLMSDDLDRDGEQAIGRAESLHRASMRKLLQGFRYFNKYVYLSLSKDYRDSITRQMELLDGVTNVDSQVVGFCSMLGEPNEEEQRDMEKITGVETANMRLSYEHYSFKFETFYEKQHGIRLIASPLSRAEQKVLSKGAKRGESDHVILQTLLDKHENIQLDEAVDLETCARLCFSQERGPWPACRSFDYVHYKTHSKTKLLGVCFLNSLTLKQAFAAQRNDLVDDQVDSISLAVHYEPRAGFVANEVELGFDLEMLASLLQNLHGNTRVGALVISCIVFVSIFSGVALGVVAATKYITLRELERERREESLLVKPTVIGFENQVDREGKVRVR